jgi:MinD-like ATPase involved in chromosome partitioning or flagellar assembly
LITCWGAKGGVGTTTVAAALAVLASDRDRTLFVDLAGDAAVALGVTASDGPGLEDWLRSSTTDRAALSRLTIEVTPSLRLLPPGPDADPVADLSRLVEVLGREPGPVVVDGGLVRSDRDRVVPLLEASDQSVLVTRPCYLALRRAIDLGVQPSATVVVTEPGRALRSSDVSRAVDATVVAEVPVDPAVARAIDAGLALTRLPRLLRRTLGPVGR